MRSLEQPQPHEAHARTLIVVSPGQSKRKLMQHNPRPDIATCPLAALLCTVCRMRAWRTKLMLNGSGHVATARRSASVNSACAARGIGGRLRGGERVSRRRPGLRLRPLRAEHHQGWPRACSLLAAGMLRLSDPVKTHDDAQHVERHECAPSHENTCHNASYYSTPLSIACAPPQRATASRSAAAASTARAHRAWPPAAR